jgi:hypothetical protein
MSPFTREPHWFVRPGVLSEDHPGLLNPTFDLLDYPIVMGRADDDFLRADNAAGDTVVLSFEQGLDRVAKIAGVLRLLGVGVSADGVQDDTPDARVHITAEVPALARELVRLAVLRLGGLLTADPAAPIRVEAAEPSQTATGAGLSELQRRSMRKLPSHVEGVRISAPDFAAVLEVLVRDGRIEPAPALELPADLVVEETADGGRITVRQRM